MTQWFDAGPLADLAKKGRRVVKAGRKQILLIADGERVFACNNRCPHEGYPLSEGTLGPSCTLTCNWHNWKFDLSSGETLVGGDQLRLYPVEERDGRVWIDVADLPAEQRRSRALANLEEACADNDYERMAREVARFIRASGDPLEPLRHMIRADAAHFEYGMTHAYAAAADWIALYVAAATEEKRLAALVEPIAHIAWDTLREPDYPYPDQTAVWSAEEFVASIASENETGAIARLNGALSGPLPADVKPAFAHAALAHYQDFGHSAIYVRKAFELIEKLGTTVAAPVLRALTRSIVYATREDRIPEFRYYAKALQKWPARGTTTHAPDELVGLSINATLDRILALEGTNEDKYRLLLEANAIAMLRFDMSVDLHVDKPVSHNVRWLDFTHALTFGNAVRQLCTETPDLWPAALLQMGCFLGRNSPFLQPHHIDQSWFVDDTAVFLRNEQNSLYDHGIREPIFACHRVKVLAAVREEAARAGGGSLSRMLLAAANRYLNTPIKLHHALRSAHQALSFVEAEG